MKVFFGLLSDVLGELPALAVPLNSRGSASPRGVWFSLNLKYSAYSAILSCLMLEMFWYTY